MFKKLLAVAVKILLIIFSIALLILPYVIWENNSVVLSKYSIYSRRLPPAFNNYNLVLISDHHNSNNVEKIIKKVEQVAPKVIIVSGDAINMHDTDYTNSFTLFEQLLKIAPTYFTSGNHETWSPDETDYLNSLKNRGVNILNNKVESIQYKRSEINIIGFKDIVYSDGRMRHDMLNGELSSLYNSIDNKSLFNLLVFHKANYFDTIAKYPFDLVLSGHLHGGQINLPVIKSKILKSRFQTDLYSKGYYRINDCQMVVSAGLEKSIRYPRVLNPPEVVEVVLKNLN
ncbi:MAG: metallophosphoesterase [Firmicutes bacterium]|nr:metallophosphoesterase [Bacillota bacterium]